MVDEPTDDGHDGTPLVERWQEEQRSWQRLILSYLDTAAMDETFLTNMGNAMRGSLLANKPYPGTSPGGAAAPSETHRSDLDEIAFAVRRLEGQVLDLTMAVEALRASVIDGSPIPGGAKPRSNETPGE